VPAAAPLTCRELIAILADYLEATLPAESVQAFERHLAVCPPCVAYVNTYRRTRELTGRAGALEMPPEMKDRLRTLLLEQLGPPGR
jgi:anti-sigma factor RsiW